MIVLGKEDPLMFQLHCVVPSYLRALWNLLCQPKQFPRQVPPRCQQDNLKPQELEGV